MPETWTCKDARKLAKMLMSFGAPEAEVWAALDLPHAKLMEIVHNNGLQEHMPFLRRAYDITESVTE